MVDAPQAKISTGGFSQPKLNLHFNSLTNRPAGGGVFLLLNHLCVVAKQGQTGYRLQMHLLCVTGLEGYGHSVIRFAYFLMRLSSRKMKRERLTVKQFCLTGFGL